MTDYNWFKTSYRRNLVDMHIDQWDETFLASFDPGQYYDCLQRGRIKSPMIYLNSHVGLCNWPSASGAMHEGFRGRNKIKELVDLCHTGGMDVIGYYSLIYNNWAYDRHPEWRMVDRNGKTSRERDAVGISCGGRYGLLCPNNLGYRSFISEQLQEMLDIYTLEGVFLDMTFWPMICHCESCCQRYLDETGLEIPYVVDWQDERWLQFAQVREQWMGEFARYCSAAVKQLRPGMPVEHNFANGCQSWQFGVDESVSEACDYTGGDLYGGSYHESFVCKMYYELTRNQPFEYMTSRCDPGLADHTTTKSEDTLRLHNYLTLAHHGAMLFIDAIDPAGTLNPAVYDTIGGVFGESIPYEPFLTGRMVSDIAVYFSLESKMDRKQPVNLTEYSYPQLRSAVGAAMALTDARHLFTVITGARKERIHDKKVVIVTDAPFLSAEEIDNFAQYVSGGGSLYMGGDTCPALAQRLLGLDVYGNTTEKITYIAPTAEGQPYFENMFSRDYPIHFNGSQLLARNPAGHTVLATITLPYTDPADPARFASIHSNPPGIKTDDPSLVFGRYGKGRVLWSASAFEGNPQHAHKDVFSRLIGLLYGGSQTVESSAPFFVQFTLFDDAERGRLLLHIVNVQEQAVLIRLGGFTVKLRTDKPVKEVKLLPEETRVPFACKDGQIIFEADRLDIFKMYLMEY
ncbi:MAG TPA: hypothetical protein DD640_03870 [Clostridiales bacterium]|nr:hypothetical protein [Clostridiales bacterium]